MAVQDHFSTHRSDSDEPLWEELDPPNIQHKVTPMITMDDRIHNKAGKCEMGQGWTTEYVFVYK